MKFVDIAQRGTTAIMKINPEQVVAILPYSTTVQGASYNWTRIYTVGQLGYIDTDTSVNDVVNLLTA